MVNDDVHFVLTVTHFLYSTLTVRLWQKQEQRQSQPPLGSLSALTMTTNIAVVFTGAAKMIVPKEAEEQ